MFEELGGDIGPRRSRGDGLLHEDVLDRRNDDDDDDAAMDRVQVEMEERTGQGSPSTIRKGKWREGGIVDEESNVDSEVVSQCVFLLCPCHLGVFEAERIEGQRGEASLRIISNLHHHWRVLHSLEGG